MLVLVIVSISIICISDLRDSIVSTVSIGRNGSICSIGIMCSIVIVCSRISVCSIMSAG